MGAGAAGIRIVRQPSPARVGAGETATFYLDAEGENLAYQWQSRPHGQEAFADIEGATESSYTTDALRVSDSHTRFRCRIVSAYDRVFSESVNLLVYGDMIGITEQPAPQKVLVGETAAYRVIANGEGLRYQWQLRAPNSTEYKDIENATEAEYTTGPLQALDTYSRFQCLINDEWGNTLTSDSANLIVLGTAPSQPSEEVTVSVTEQVHFDYGDGATDPPQAITASVEPSHISNRRVKWEILGGSAGKYRLLTAPVGGTEIRQGEFVPNWIAYIVPLSTLNANDGVTVRVTSAANEEISAQCAVVMHQAEVVTHTLTFYAPDASVYYSPRTVKVPHNGKAILPDTPVRVGAAFDGWYTGYDGTGIRLSDTLSITSDMVFYARWETLSQYRVTLDWNYDGNKDVLYYTEGQTLPLPDRYRDGYTFDGWYTGRYGGSRVQYITPEDRGNKTLYAHWVAAGDPRIVIGVTPETADITYGANAITLWLSASNLPAGSAVQLSATGGYLAENTLYIDGNGAASAVVYLPADMRPGFYEITATYSARVNDTAIFQVTTSRPLGN